MAWKVTLKDHEGNERSMLLDDLSAEDFATVCAPYADTNWLRLYQSPASHPLAFYDLLCRCAMHLEVPSPDRPANIRQTRALLDYIEPVDDDLPNSFSESGVPLHEAGEVETTTSSTSIEPADGHLPSPDANR
jgi:hypothetical protein